MDNCTLLFHYAEKEPEMYKIPGEVLFMSGLSCLIESEIINYSIFVDSSESGRRYNKFQKSDDVPDWEKIATGLMLNYSLILDEDRPIIINSLEKTILQCDKKDSKEIIKKIIDKISQLDKGPIVFTHGNTIENGDDTLVKRRVNIEDLKNHLQIYTGNPTYDELHCWLDENALDSPVNMDTALKLFPRATSVPRYWR